MALISMDAWASNVNGREIWDDPAKNSNQVRAECTYLWRDFLIRVIGAPWEAGVSAGRNAFELWTRFGQIGVNDNRPAPDHLTRIPRSQGGRRGDAVIWAPNTGWTFTEGHVAVLEEDNGSSIKVWSQNVPQNSGTQLLTLSGIQLEGIYGFLRPKNNNPTPDQEEEEPMYQIIESDGKHYFATANGVVVIESEDHRKALVQALTVLKIRDKIEPEGGMGPITRNRLTYYVNKARG